MPSSSTALTSLGVSGVTGRNMAAETHTATTTLAGDSDIQDSTQIIGTSSEVIDMGEIAAGGAEYVEITNLDATNFLSVGFENPAVAGTKTFKIKAGQSGLFPTPSAALYGIADTDPVTIRIKGVKA
jgi:hypothetical protein